MKQSKYLIKVRVETQIPLVYIINFLTTEHLKILPYNSTQLKLYWLMLLKSLILQIWLDLGHQDNLSRIWAFFISGLCSFYWFLSLALYKGKLAVSSCSPITSQDQVHQGRLLTSLLRISAKVLLWLTGSYWGTCLCVGPIPIALCVRCSDWPWFTRPPLKQAVGILPSIQSIWHKNRGTGTFFKGELDYCSRRKFIRIGKIE